QMLRPVRHLRGERVRQFGGGGRATETERHPWCRARPLFGEAQRFGADAIGKEGERNGPTRYAPLGVIADRNNAAALDQSDVSAPCPADPLDEPAVRVVLRHLLRNLRVRYAKACEQWEELRRVLYSRQHARSIPHE